jgi:zinc transporter 1/2/3
MTIFLMFFIELMAARFDVFGEKDHDHDLEASDPSTSFMRQGEKRGESSNQIQIAVAQQASPVLSGEVSDSNLIVPAAHHSEFHSHSPSEATTLNDPGEGPSKPLSSGNTSIPGRADDFSYPPGGEDHLGHHRDHDISDDHFAAQMTGIFILEFGVLFHSVFIGLTLAVAGSNFTVLYIVLVFHQTFEGLGLGSRLATAEWPKRKRWMPWVLGMAYGVSTPIAIAIGLGIRTTFAPGSQNTMIINGVFDSISAGILIYTGLVELMAHEFMFNPEMRKSSIKMMMFAFLCMCLGAGLMALLGKWA